MVHDETYPMNNNAARAFNCLYFFLLINAQGGHELIHLQTNAVVKRRHCTPGPVTPPIIKQFYKISSQYSMPKGLKVTNCMNLVLFESSWIVGVYHKGEAFDNPDYE